MVYAGELKSVDFCRKRDACFSGMMLLLLAALIVLFLNGMVLSISVAFGTSTYVIDDSGTDWDSFPAQPYDYASADVSNILGTDQLYITKKIRKCPTYDKNIGVGSMCLSSDNFDNYSHEYPIMVVKFYAPWCYYSQQLAPAWETAAKIIGQRYGPVMGSRILIGEVDCVDHAGLCDRNHIQGFPTIQIFRNGSDGRGEDGHGNYDHESYCGDRDPESLIAERTQVFM